MQNMEVFHSKYEQQCRELNMDRDTEVNGWKQILEVSQRFTLDGDIQHWFSCALYASCRESFTPTVGNALVIGNCVSLTKLLRCCNISIYKFLSKIKKWHDMASLSEGFKNHIETLERNFSLTFLLCQHYIKIFRVVFLTTNIDKRSNTKFRSSVCKCSYQKLSDFAWLLFLCAKNECASDLDLETLFNLLVCCIDLIYSNVLYENRIDLINPKFKNVPEQSSPATQELPCIVQELSDIVDVAAKDAKLFKDTKWQNILTQLFDAKNLYGNRQTLLEIISNHNFERSWKSLNAAYEQFILGIGAFDERILLNNQNVLNALESSVGGESGGACTYENNDYSQSILALSPEQSQKVVVPDMDTAGDKLKKLFEFTLTAQQPLGILCNVNEMVLQQINNKFDDMSADLRLKSGNKLHGKDVFGLIRPLYFHLLENIIRVEVHNKPHIVIETFLDTYAFNTTLFVCCAEIVLDSYNCDLKFPWILDCFKIDGFIFSKIIELVVARHDSILNRLHVKHLNYTEECCLESLAWRAKSKIWEIIKMHDTSLPAWSDVDKNSVANKDGSSNLRTPTTSATKTTTATPHATPTCDTAKKDLFNVAKAGVQAAATDEAKVQGAANQCGRIASLSIFLRKFYKLAWHRLKEMCGELNMQNGIDKVWTLFEYSVTQRTHLLENRHLDQIIMCAIYIYVKVTAVPTIKFTDILKAYRKQPQSHSTIYREVLIEYAEEDTRAPVYKDLIYFYNNVYVNMMTPYALDFSERRVPHLNLLLSPHPSERQNLPKQILNHKIFVSPMEKTDIKLSPDTLIYGIGKSPAKELQMMNDVVRRGKRNLPFNDESCGHESPKSKYAPAHLSSFETVMKDRRAESFSTRNVDT